MQKFPIIVDIMKSAGKNGQWQSSKSAWTARILLQCCKVVTHTHIHTLRTQPSAAKSHLLVAAAAG